MKTIFYYIQLVNDVSIRSIFIDLHGVLANTAALSKQYETITTDHLVTLFNLTEEDAGRRYSSARFRWKEDAINYLKNPKTPKSGDDFMEFFNACDAQFAKYLYEGLDTSSFSESLLRTKPFEYAVSCHINALYPEVREALEQLSGLGYELHAASSSHSSHVKGFLRGNLIEHYFETITGFDTVEATKHTYAFYQRMLEQAGVEPEDAIMLGNSLQEIIKPRKIGMITVHVKRERYVPHEIQKLATLIVKNLRPIPDQLGKID